MLKYNIHFSLGLKRKFTNQNFFMTLLSKKYKTNMNHDVPKRIVIVPFLSSSFHSLYVPVPVY